MASNTQFVYTQPDVFTVQRKQMVTTQIANRGILSVGILDSLSCIPRHLFINSISWDVAYEDRPVGLDCGQTISQPYMVAKVAELLELSGNETILEVGSGCGYQAAVLSQLAKAVYGVEYHPTLAEQSEATLEKLGLDNVTIRLGDGKLGWQAHAPFDRLLFSCAIPKLPPKVDAQLAVGGIAVFPLQLPERQMLMKWRKREDGWEKQEIFRVRYVPLL